jgi:hypothetical protein
VTEKVAVREAIRKAAAQRFIEYGRRLREPGGPEITEAELVATEALITELTGILGRAKFATKLRQKNLSAAEIVARYREIAETIEAAPSEEAHRRSGVSKTA